MFPGQERFGEKSFHEWTKNFKPDVIWTHLDFQMFMHVAQTKKPRQATIPLYNPDTGKILTAKERKNTINNIKITYKQNMQTIINKQKKHNTLNSKEKREPKKIKI